MNIPSLIVFCLLLYGLLKRRSLLLYLCFGLLAFGSLSVIPSQLLGGTTVLASSFAFALLCLRLFLVKGAPQRIFRSALDIDKMAGLTLFTTIAVVGAFILPRIYGPEVYVFPMNTTDTPFPVRLQPSGGNFNQSINMMISCSVAIAFCALASSRKFLNQYKLAILWGAGGICLTGVADLIAPYCGLQPVLASFRTASYLFLTDQEVMGAHRVVGLMSEASSFGALAAAMGALTFFSRYAYPIKQRLKIVLPLSLMCFALSALSTSSTAFLLLFVVLILHFADLVRRMVGPKKLPVYTLLAEVAAVIMLSLLIALFLCLKPGIANYIFEMIRVIVFEKQTSQSYLERSSWTNQAIDAFRATHGIGVGVGSERASNLFINILASTGIIGGVIFGAFVLRTLLSRPRSNSPETFELVQGAKYATLVVLTAEAISGTTPDYGVFVAALMGIIIGFAERMRIRLGDPQFTGINSSNTMPYEDIKAGRPARSGS